MLRGFDWFEHNLGLSPDVQVRIATTCLIFAALLVTRRIALYFVYRRIDDARGRYRWRKALTYVTLPLALLLAARLWVEGAGRILTFLGLVSAAVVIALKDLVTDLAGWVFIVSRRPFEVGDRIQIGTFAGDVIDVRLFQFTLNEIGVWVDADQSTGRIVHVPNSRVLTDPIANYSRGFKYIWHEIPVRLTLKSNWQKAKDILLRIVNKSSAHLTPEAHKYVLEASREYLITYNKLTPTVYTRVVGPAIQLTLRYITEPRQRRESEHAIWETFLAELPHCEDIELAS